MRRCRSRVTARSSGADVPGASVPKVAALLAELGARSGERALQVLALMATGALSFVAFSLFISSVVAGEGGYAQNLVDRIQYLWPVPALVAFAGCRIGGDAFWRQGLPLRSFACAVAAAMAFASASVLPDLE